MSACSRSLVSNPIAVRLVGNDSLDFSRTIICFKSTSLNAPILFFPRSVQPSLAFGISRNHLSNRSPRNINLRGCLNRKLSSSHGLGRKGSPLVCKPIGIRYEETTAQPKFFYRTVIKLMVVRQQGVNNPKHLKLIYFASIATVSLFLGLLFLWISSPHLTFRGVPLSILLRFSQDPIAQNAYFSGHKKALHDRLKALGIKEQIKDFYRPQIHDEMELDRYIHQLLYNNIGYVGSAYVVNPKGQLELKSTSEFSFSHWFELAKKLQIVKAHQVENGVMYVTTLEGNRVPYSSIAPLYAVTDMEKWVQAQQGT